MASLVLSLTCKHFVITHRDETEYECNTNDSFYLYVRIYQSFLYTFFIFMVLSGDMYLDIVLE